MRIAPVTQEMVLNYRAEHALGLPGSISVRFDTWIPW